MDGKSGYNASEVCGFACVAPCIHCVHRRSARHLPSSALTSGLALRPHPRQRRVLCVSERACT